MKLKKNFVLRQVADTWVVLPIGERAADLKGMISLNDTGALLWRIVEQNGDLEAMVNALISEYEVSRETATSDAAAFLKKLQNGGFLEE